MFPDAAGLQDVNLSFESSVSETTHATRLVQTPPMKRAESNYPPVNIPSAHLVKKRSTILFRIKEHDFLPKPKDILVKFVPIKQSLVSGRSNGDFKKNFAELTNNFRNSPSAISITIPIEGRTWRHIPCQGNLSRRSVQTSSKMVLRDTPNLCEAQGTIPGQTLVNECSTGFDQTINWTFDEEKTCLQNGTNKFCFDCCLDESMRSRL